MSGLKRSHSSSTAQLLKNPSLHLRKKGMERSNRTFFVANTNVLNQVCVYKERVYADNVVSKFWFTNFFLPKITPQLLTQCFQKRFESFGKECRARSLIWEVTLYFLWSSIHIDCYIMSAVILSCSNECVYIFNKIRNGRVQTEFETVQICWLLVSFIRHELLSVRYWYLGWEWYFRNCNLHLTLQILFLHQIFLKSDCGDWNCLRSFTRNQPYFEQFFCWRTLIKFLWWKWPYEIFSCSNYFVYGGDFLEGVTKYSKVSCVNSSFSPFPKFISCLERQSASLVWFFRSLSSRAGCCSLYGLDKKSERNFLSRI